MRYYELKITTDSMHSEEVQAMLIEAGFASMQIDDAMDAKDIAEHPDVYKYDYISEEIARKAAQAGINAGGGTGDVGASQAGSVIITMYFADDGEGRGLLEEAEALLARMQAAGQAGSGAEGLQRSGGREVCGPHILSYNVSLTGDDSGWLYKWQEHFRPAKVGSRIVVKPGWESYEAQEGELIIEMDPGMAFGSGLHETTSMCIKALEDVIGEKLSSGEGSGEGSGLRVLDVGTGTGILAIASVLLGADEALGIDIDSEAIRVSKENTERNGLSDRVSIMQGNLMDGTDYAPDIIAANLMADLVMMLSPAAAAALRPGGVYITSGILDIKEEAVSEAIRAAGFDIREIMREGEWRAIVAVKS